MEKTLTQQMLNKYLHDHQKEIFEDFAYTISFPSVKSAAEDGAPFGRECARCLDGCRGLFEKYGFKTEMYADLGYALAYFDKKPVDGDEYTAMLAHTDVVPVTPEDWVLTEPFKMIDTGKNLVGRGVSDDKDGVIASLYLFRAMKDLGYTPKHPFVVFLGSNEEAGMQDVRNYKANQKPLPKVCLVPDSSFPASFGERGNFHA